VRAAVRRDEVKTGREARAVQSVRDAEAQGRRVKKLTVDRDGEVLTAKH